MNLLLLCLLLVSPASVAEDTVDSHNFQLVPNDGELTDVLSTWSSKSYAPGTFAGSFLFETGTDPLSLYSESSGIVTSAAIVRDYSALNLGVFYSPHKRVAVTASAPLFLYVDGTGPRSGVGIGNLRLATPVSVVLPENSRVGVSVVPFLDVPGIYGDSYMGSSTASGGGLVASSVEWDKAFVSANAGVDFSSQSEYFNVRGGSRVMASVAGGTLLSEDLAVRGEVRYSSSVRRDVERFAEQPLEGLLSVKGHSADVLSWTLGGSSAFNNSVGAPVWRVFAGFNLTSLPRKPEECTSCIGSLLVVQGGASLGSELQEQPRDLTDSSVHLQDGSVFVIECQQPDVQPVQDSPCVLDPVAQQQSPPTKQRDAITVEPIYFDFNGSTIRMPDSFDVLDELVSTLQSRQDFALVEVAGHTDERGSHAYNDSLSQARVNAVVRYLVDHGVDESRLRPVGYGERIPLTLCSADDEDCHQANRRVEFVILERR